LIDRPRPIVTAAQAAACPNSSKVNLLLGQAAACAAMTAV
jgi:hypothetical protein